MKSISTPEIRQENPMAKIAEEAGLTRGRPVQGVVILALPGADEEAALKFKGTMDLLAEFMPFNVAITYSNVAALTKEDILEWKDKIDHIAKEAGWLDEAK